MKTCSVYIMHQKETTYYKIGIASDVEQRLTQVDCVGTEIILIREYVLENRDDAYKMEQALLFFLKPFHVKGEWFNLNRFILGELDEFILRFVDYQSAHYWHQPRHEYFATAIEYNGFTKFLHSLAEVHPEYIAKSTEHCVVIAGVDKGKYDPITFQKINRNKLII